MINKQKFYREPLLNTLHKAFHLSMQTGKHASSPDDVAGLYNLHAERRRFISNMVKAGMAIGAAGFLEGCKKVADVVPPAQDAGDFARRKISQPSIVIIGAGLAGLNCAWNLKKLGYSSKVFEGSSRIGGRIFTKYNVMAPGLYTECGGEFIDTNHKDMLALCNEFGLGLLDTESAAQTGYVRDSFYINGRFHSESEVIRAFMPYASRIRADINSLPDEMTYDNHDATTVAFDNMSIAAYLDSIGMDGFLRKGIETAYLTEYGLDTDLQSSINFLFLFSPNTKNGFHIFGESDERYKVEGGNQTVTQAVYNKVKDQVVLEYKLLRIKEANSGYSLYFMNKNGTTEKVEADIVVSAIPFTLLREVELDVQLPGWKRNAIENLGYGTNAKLLLGFKKRVWRNYQHSGYAFSDKQMQTGWDNSWAQPGTSGGYTIYLGGTDGLLLGNGTAESQAPQFLNELERMWPGCRQTYNGNVKRMQWPSNPFSKGSYSCYRTGQYTTIRGAEKKSIGNLYFAGEHCSANFQGFMNGAAETGRKTANKIKKAIETGQPVANG